MKTVQTVNIGALSLWYQLNNREDHKRLTQVINNIISHMKSNLRNFTAAREIYSYYIKNKDLTRKTVLKDLKDDEKANKIYTDPIYGMGNWITLKNWVDVVLGIKPDYSAKYEQLKAHFGLNNEEMFNLTNKNSMLAMLSALGQGKCKERW